MKTRIRLSIAATALMATCGFAAPETVTVYRASDCQDVPLAVQGACMEHRDSKEPFRYLRFDLEEDCLALPDSAIARACYARTQADSSFAIAKSQLRAPRKTTEETIEANTHATMVISAVQLGRAVASIATAAVLFAFSDCPPRRPPTSADETSADGFCPISAPRRRATPGCRSRGRCLPRRGCRPP